jgi:hypothetical protein
MLSIDYQLFSCVLGFTRNGALKMLFSVLSYCYTVLYNTQFADGYNVQFRVY